MMGLMDGSEGEGGGGEGRVWGVARGWDLGWGRDLKGIFGVFLPVISTCCLAIFAINEKGFFLRWSSGLWLMIWDVSVLWVKNAI
jgi:hypothetical protein